MRIILLILLFLNCKDKEFEIDEVTNFFLVDDFLIHSLINNELKPKGKCKKGEIVENVEHRIFNRKNKDESFYNSYWFLKCKEFEGYYHFDEKEQYKYFKSKDLNYLKENKEKLFELYEYHKQMEGFFVSQEDHLTIQYLGEVTTDDSRIRYVASIMLSGGRKAKEYNVSKIADYYYRMYNDKNDFTIKREGKFIYIEVKKGEQDIKSFHRKRLMEKVIEIIYPDQDYEENDKK